MKLVLGMQVDGDPALPASKRGQSPPPQFSAHFYCGQTVACIKMPLGMEVGVSPGYFALDGDPAPNFRPMFIIVILISLEHCIIVTGLLKFKLVLFLEKKSLIVLSMCQYKY